MEVTIEEKSTLDRELKFVLTVAEVDQRMDQELSRLSSTVRLPGFRPGKIPRKILEARFKDHIIGTISDQFFRESYPKALDEHSLTPVDNPELSFGKLERGKEFTYSASIQLFPKVEPVGYTGLTLTRKKAEITDADVDKVIEEIRTNQSRFETVEGRTAEKGDQILMDFEGFVDGVAFAGGKAEKHLLELGSSRFIPGFEEQLLTSKAGDNREVKVTFPGDYGNKDLANKEAIFKCLVHEVRIRLIPDIDDELAKKAGVTEGGMEKLREVIKGRMKEDAEAKEESKLERAILDALLQANTFAVPSRIVAREQQNMLETMKREYQSRGLGSARLNFDDEKLLAALGDSASERIRLGFLFSAIATKENIQPDEAQVEKRLDEMTLAFGSQADEIKRTIRQNEDRMGAVREAVVRSSVAEWIVNHSTVTTEPCSLDELLGSSNPEKGK